MKPHLKLLMQSVPDVCLCTCYSCTTIHTNASCCFCYAFVCATLYCSTRCKRSTHASAPSVLTHFQRVVQAFEGFRLAVKDQRKLCSTLTSVAARLLSQNIAAAFATWVDAVQLRRSRTTAAQAHHLLRVLRATCNAWAECVAVELLERERKVSGFIARHQPARTASLQRRTFAAWWQALACGGITDQQQRLMRQCMNRMHRRHIGVMFDAWRSATEARYERMRRLLILRSKLLKVSALQCWCVSSSLLFNVPPSSNATFPQLTKLCSGTYLSTTTPFPAGTPTPWSVGSSAGCSPRLPLACGTCICVMLLPVGRRSHVCAFMHERKQPASANGYCRTVLQRPSGHGTSAHVS